MLLFLKVLYFLKKVLYFLKKVLYFAVFLHKIGVRPLILSSCEIGVLGTRNALK